MSIASEITRLQQAKSDLATSIAAKGVTVSAATTIDGYAALVDSIQGLPYDARIEYIEGTGTQWIDTGIKVAGSDIVSVDMTFTVTALNSGTNTILCGAYDNTGSQKRLFLYVTSAGKISIAYSTTYSTSNSLAAGADYVCTFAFRSGRQNTLFNTIPGGTNLTGNIPENTSFAVFTAKFGSSTLDITKMKLRHFSMSKNNSLLIDLVPVRVGQVGYMYDAVSGELFGNVGTGNFTLGPDVV